MKTVLITGCSSGFGLETARYFLERNWKVVATMRTPREDVLPSSANLRVLALDVTDPESIRQAVEAAGPLDALVNNAGFGSAAPFEVTPMPTIRELFETNTFGTMAVTQAVLPQFRECRAGVVVNVTSSVTLKAIPLIAAYTASKAAVNAFTESMALELGAFGVRAHLVLPGRAPETRFGENGRAHMQGLDHEAYAGVVQRFMAGLREPGPITHARDVAEAVWRAVTDPSSAMRIPAGADAEMLAGGH
ncbi:MULTISPECIES: SDR family oxidoreductase [Pandoraea]|uniref:Short-chain dehydrogenase/reductase SDR n=1 Tax=Pandoraea communis TaxID=2508297 RepID=A0A5E4VX62_9BURK|nr:MULTISPECIES: SDR family oxidoreductase [Pandoraea]EON15730.1 short-chain dehydrogenase/reductase SDR [Pandoraea sp. SD6-2]VVE16126.1 short-chain dehydrogenase/reductase SDR [Pandoraea communis]